MLYRFGLTVPFRFGTSFQAQLKKILLPKSNLDTAEGKRRSKLLSSLMLVVLVVGGLIITHMLATKPNTIDDPDTITSIVGLLAVFGAYLVNRAGNTNLSAMLFIAILSLVFVVSPFLEGSEANLLFFAILPILVSGMFFQFRTVAYISTVIVSASLLLSVISSADDDNLYLYALQFLIFGSAIVLTSLKHQQAMEQLRSSELQAMNARLQMSEASLEQRVRERTRDLTIATVVSTQATTILDRDELLAGVVMQLRSGFDFYFVSIHLFEEDRVVYAAGEKRGERTYHPTDPIIEIYGRGLIAKTARERRMSIVNDTSSAPDYRADPQLPDTQSEVSIPMIVGGNLLGVLDLQSEERDRFTDENLAVLPLVAEQIGIAIQNANLFADQVKVAEELRAVDNMKSQFLASMSHELRTPLNAILNFTEFMSLGILGPVNEKQKDALDKTLSSGKHLLSLINDILDITKIESGMMKLFVENNVDLRQELNTAITMAQTLLEKSTVKFNTEIDEDLPIVVGDKRRIRQIFINLVSNAVKFTEKGHITLRAHRRDDMISFSVEDTGPGISPEEEHIIFEPFQQTAVGIHHAGGTGLGLPISKRLAEAHGGELWFESTAGQGTTFFATLPVRSEALLAMIQMPEAQKEAHV